MSTVVAEMSQDQRMRQDQLDQQKGAGNDRGQPFQMAEQAWYDAELTPTSNGIYGRRAAGEFRPQGAINVGETERWLSMAAGASAIVYALRNRTAASWLLGALGGGLLYRGVTGYCPVYGALKINQATSSVEPVIVKRAVTVNKPIDEVYHFWRNLENLPRFMRHVESVVESDDGSSHWVVTGPTGSKLQWDAQLVAEQENRLIAWETLPNASIQHRGRVHFKEAPADRGTEVHVSLAYYPPGGAVGKLFAELYNPVTAEQIKEQIRNFKSLLEAGEIPTTEGQPRCE